MSDNGRIMGDMRERQAVAEAQLKAATERLGVVGDRLHKVENSATALVLLAEEAKEDRDALGHKIDAISEKIDPMMVAVAQGATTTAMHIAQCADLNKQQDTRHTENQARFGRIERTIWMAVGGASALSSMITIAVAIGIAMWKH